MEESLDKSQRQIGTLEGRLSLTQQALVMSFSPSINLGFLGSGAQLLCILISKRVLPMQFAGQN